MWARLRWTLERIVPAAEAAGIRLALHPTDPPVRSYRGVAQILVDFAECRRLVAMVDSPSNSFFLDTGVATEWGEDAVAVTEHFGGLDRVGMVHFRNCITKTPYLEFVETFIDDGQCDMQGCMRALVSAGYSGGVDPDHTPRMTNDSADTHIGWGLALGYIAALRDTCIAEAQRPRL